MAKKPRYNVELLTEKLNGWRMVCIGNSWGSKSNRFDFEEVQKQLGHISRTYFGVLKRCGIFEHLGRGIYAFKNVKEPVNIQRIQNAFKQHSKESLNYAKKSKERKSQPADAVTVTVVKEHKRFDFSVEDALELLKSKGYKITIEL